MKRIECNDVTETLMKAMEYADNMENVIVLYEGKEGCPSGFFENGVELSTANWMVDVFKHFLLNAVEPVDGAE